MRAALRVARAAGVASMTCATGAFTTTTTTATTTRSTTTEPASTLIRRLRTIMARTTTSTRRAITTTPRLFASTSYSGDFQEPNRPPGTHGTPVFEDIDLGVSLQQEKGDHYAPVEEDGSLVVLESQQRNLDPEAVFVVTGASRGIGLQFVKSLMDRTKGTIVAACRSPSTAEKLLNFVHSLPDDNNNNNDNDLTKRRLHLAELDLENQESIEAFGTILRDKYERVDALFNVAGLLGDGGKTTAGPERSITKMDRMWVEKTMAVNLIGPMMLCKEVAPLLMQRRGQRRSGSSSSSSSSSSNQKSDDNHQGGSSRSRCRRPISVVVNLSARVGSISDNQLGGWYSYRMSKSALNQATRTLALELKRQSAWAIALHPGTTDTDLSQPFQANVKPGSLFPVDFTVERLLDIVDAMEEKHSGGFYDWAGQSLSF